MARERLPGAVLQRTHRGELEVSEQLLSQREHSRHGVLRLLSVGLFSGVRRPGQSRRSCTHGLRSRFLTLGCGGSHTRRYPRMDIQPPDAQGMIMPLTFAQADVLFRQDKLNELVADAEGRR